MNTNFSYYLLPNAIGIAFAWILINSNTHDYFSVRFEDLYALDFTRDFSRMINGIIIIVLPLVHHLLQICEVPDALYAIYYLILVNIIHTIIDIINIYREKSTDANFIHIFIWLFMFFIDENELHASLVLFSINGLSNILIWYNDFVAIKKNITFFAFKLQYVWYVFCRLIALIVSIVYVKNGLYICATLNLITVLQTVNGLNHMYNILKCHNMI